MTTTTALTAAEIANRALVAALEKKYQHASRFGMGDDCTRLLAQIDEIKGGKAWPEEIAAAEAKWEEILKAHYS